MPQIKNENEELRYNHEYSTTPYKAGFLEYS